MKPIPPLLKYRAFFVLFMLMSSAITLFCIYVDDQYAPLLFVNLIFWGLLMRNVRCDSCGTALVPPIGGSFLRIVKSFFQKNCKQCGAGLD